MRMYKYYQGIEEKKEIEATGSETWVKSSTRYEEGMRVYERAGVERVQGYRSFFLRFLYNRVDCDIIIDARHKCQVGTQRMRVSGRVTCAKICNANATLPERTRAQVHGEMTQCTDTRNRRQCVQLISWPRISDAPLLISALCR